MTYNFDIEYVKTDDFGNDILSRLLPEDEDFVIACASLEYNIKPIYFTIYFTYTAYGSTSNRKKSNNTSCIHSS